MTKPAVEGFEVHAAKSKSWRRELARAGLVAAILLGLPLAAGAAARYRQHIRACYWAWRWAEASRGRGGYFNLRSRLEDIGAPPAAWAMACRLAYARANGDASKREAADTLRIRDLYALVRRAGSGSPAEEAFKTRMGLLCSEYIDDAELEAMGAEEIWRSDQPEGWLKGPREGETFDWTPLGFTFGSYDVGVMIWKIRDGIARPGGPCYERRWVSVNRLPGPWREPPPPPEPPGRGEL